MAKRQVVRGTAAGASLIFHVFAQDSTATDGAGKASIAYGSWSCRYIRNGEALSGAITPEDITTIGTYAAPTANTNIRIKAVDNTNAIGLYEVHIHADWVNGTNTCKSLVIYLTAAGVAVLPLEIELIGFDVQATAPKVDLVDAPNATAVTAIQSGLATPTNITQAVGIVLSPVVHSGVTIPNVSIVDTCTTNSDMRGTDGAMLDTENGSSFSAIPDMATAANQATIAGYIDTEIGALPTTADIKAALEAAGSDLDFLVRALVNKLLITEATGDAELFTDAGASSGTVAACFTSIAGVTQRKALRI